MPARVIDSNAEGRDSREKRKNGEREAARYYRSFSVSPSDTLNIIAYDKGTDDMLKYYLSHFENNYGVLLSSQGGSEGWGRGRDGCPVRLFCFRTFFNYIELQ